MQTKFSLKASVLLVAVCATASAQTVLPTIRVSDEVVPPGGMAQMKVLLTSPKPITTGNMGMDLSGVLFDSVDGIALFNASGDVVGTATVDVNQVNVHFTSPKGTFGATLDYPILTVALRLSKFVVPGQTFTVSLNPNASFWKDLFGSNITFELKPGTITVGGSVNISNVVPGTGALPAGSRFSIFGAGFTPATKTVLTGAKNAIVQYVSPTELRATLVSAATLDGMQVQVLNPDKSTDSYFSYMRAVPVGQSAVSLIARTVPVFSLLTATEAVLPPTVSPVNAAFVTALALQNPSPLPATITLEGRNAAGTVLASVKGVLPSGAKISRTVSEALGITLPVGGYVHIASDQPVEALGILADTTAGTVTPLAVTILAGPPASGVIDGTSNKGGKKP